LPDVGSFSRVFNVDSKYTHIEDESIYFDLDNISSNGVYKWL